MIREYWDRALAPFWPKIRTLLEAAGLVSSHRVGPYARTATAESLLQT